MKNLSSLTEEACWMIHLKEREASFTNWPFQDQMSPQNMAKAGWYQVGELSARHFITLKELDGWEGNNNQDLIFRQFFFYI